MLSIAEILTAVGALTTVAGLSIATTLYVAQDDGHLASPSHDELHSIDLRRYVLSDAYYLCRDHIGTAVPGRVRNLYLDSHSSRYDENGNNNVVFIELQLVDSAPSYPAQDAQVECRVSAASNKIKSFQVRKS